MTVHCAALDTAVGPLCVAYAEGMIVRTGLHIALAQFARDLTREFGARPVIEAALPDRLCAVVDATLRGEKGSGRPAAIDLARLPAFQRRVLAATARIPRGEVRTYGGIAAAIGAPGAARAVGTALARNPFPLLIPCHRVVRADGQIGEYSGGGSGIKRRLLAMEGALPSTPAEAIQSTR